MMGFILDVGTGAGSRMITAWKIKDKIEMIFEHESGQFSLIFP